MILPIYWDYPMHINLHIWFKKWHFSFLNNPKNIVLFSNTGNNSNGLRHVNTILIVQRSNVALHVAHATTVVKKYSVCQQMERQITMYPV